MKTLKDWYDSEIDKFEDFFIPGDIVSQDVVEHFRNVMIPKTDNAYLMQMGEAQDFVDGKSTYMTFANEGNGWTYKGNCYKGENKTPFEKWLDRFIEEKDIDITEEFKAEKDGVSKIFSYKDVLNNIKTTSENEQGKIKDMLIKIDFNNGDVKDFLKHLSKALIPSQEEIKNMEEIYGKTVYGIEKQDEEESEEDEL